MKPKTMNPKVAKDAADASVNPPSKQSMPDVSEEVLSPVRGTIDRVGMSGIELPIFVKSSDGSRFRVPAKVEAFVSLDRPNAKGIHMSRLYNVAKALLDAEPLSFEVIKSMLLQFVDSQAGLSQTSQVKINFELPVERKALMSDRVGWRQYPVEIKGTYRFGGFTLEVGGKVLYSSTCPCSAALSRQLIAQKFEDDFMDPDKVSRESVLEWLSKESSFVATPHAQRSQAHFKLKLSPQAQELDLVKIIDGIERALGTPVQAAVKRQDEQEFARRNGTQLMFCEDAGRKLKAHLNQLSEVEDFWARLEHWESLHPHDAVAEISKGLPEGY